MSKFMDAYQKLINCKVNDNGNVTAYDYNNQLINLNDIDDDKD